MASELIAGLGLFKTMFDLSKGLKDAADAATRNSVAIELQEKILTAQAQQAALIERIGELEKELARFEEWEAEKQRYMLTDYGGGTFAYALRSEESRGEPTHRICAACYQDGHKSILQFRHTTAVSQEKYNCPRCRTEFLWNPPERASPLKMVSACDSACRSGQSASIFASPGRHLPLRLRFVPALWERHLSWAAVSAEC